MQQQPKALFAARSLVALSAKPEADFHEYLIASQNVF